MTEGLNEGLLVARLVLGLLIAAHGRRSSLAGLAATASPARPDFSNNWASGPAARSPRPRAPASSPAVCSSRLASSARSARHWSCP